MILGFLLSDEPEIGALMIILVAAVLIEWGSIIVLRLIIWSILFFRVGGLHSIILYAIF